MIIYRVRDQGLEVFMVNPDALQTNNNELPQASAYAPERLLEITGGIKLDSVTAPNGAERKAIA